MKKASVKRGDQVISMRKPAFSKSIRIGLLSIAHRISPSCEIERRAVEWIDDTCRWQELRLAADKRMANAREKGKSR